MLAFAVLLSVAQEAPKARVVKTEAKKEAPKKAEAKKEVKADVKK